MNKSGAESAPTGSEFGVNLPSLWLTRAAVAGGLACSGAGLAIGTVGMGGVVPLGVGVFAFAPIAAAMCYVPPQQVSLRTGLVSSAGLPIGIMAAPLLAMAGTPPLACAMFLGAPALAAGYSSFHIVDTQECDLGLISVPESPFSRGLFRMGLWNQYTPWAHASFRSVVKLFVYWTALGVMPTFVSIYGWWDVWLMCVWAWKWSGALSVSAMSFGYTLRNVDDILSPDVVGQYPYIMSCVRSWGDWFLHNHFTEAMWIYAFYMLPAVALFYMWFKWRYGVSTTPFGDASTDAPTKAAPRHR